MSVDEYSDPEVIKSCCSKFYENDLIALVLGDNFHPGGEKLTLFLGERLGLNKTHFVLDVACGSGASAIVLAKRFGCHVLGCDLSEKNLKKAEEKANSAGLSNLLEFVQSDAEKLNFEDETFDAVICECALCTFPDGKTAVNEMYRVAKKDGKVGITDVTLEHEIPNDLKNIVYHVACIAGAQPAKGYMRMLGEGGFRNVEFEDHSYTIREIIEKAERLIRGWDVIKNLCDCDIDSIFGITQKSALELIERGFEELDKKTFGYGLFIGIKE